MDMKNYVFNFIILALTFCTVGCKRNATFIKTETDSIRISVGGQYDTIIVQSDGDWNITSPEWVSTEMHDNLLLCISEENTTGAIRNGEIVLSCGNIKKTIAITQPDHCTFIKTSKDNVQFNQDGGKQSVIVYTDAKDVDVKTDGPVQFSFNKNVLDISVSRNESKAINATITLTADSIKHSISISQDGNICKRCNGSGRILCPKCKGKTYLPGTVCKQCGGEGLGYCCNFTGLDYCRNKHLNTYGDIVCPECKGEKTVASKK